MTPLSYSFAASEVFCIEVLTFEATDQSLIVILDPSGNWGEGYEAATVMARLLEERWRTAFPSNSSEIGRQLKECASQSRLRESWLTGIGAIALLLCENGAVEIIHAGDHEIARFESGERIESITPPRWVDEQVEVGHMSPEEAKVSPMRNILLGPLIDTGFNLHGPWAMESGQLIVVLAGDYDNALEDTEIAECLKDPKTAPARLQELGLHRIEVKYPVIVVWRPDCTPTG